MYSSCKFQFFDLLKRLLLSSAFDLLSTDFSGKILLDGKRAPQSLWLYLLSLQELGEDSLKYSRTVEVSTGQLGGIKEEIANSVTHGLGLILSIIGLVMLVMVAQLRGNTWHIVSCSVYGTTLVLLYLSSTLYHSFQNVPVRHLLRIFDHSSIYLLIAGTYTPFTLVSLQGTWGWILFSTIWCLAVIGILFKCFIVESFQTLSVVFYILMGWLVVVAIKPLLAVISMSGFLWLLAGGLCYTAGVFFFVFKRIPYNHTIWHMFVLAGSFCHFFAVFFYVLPQAT